MKRGSSIFIQILVLLLCACLLTAVLTSVLYNFTGAKIYAQRIADEMYPRVEAISRLATRFQTGQVSFDSFIDFAVKEHRNTQIFIFDDQGNTIAYSAGNDSELVLKSISGYVSSVLSSGNAFISTNWRSVAGIVVGTPIYDNMQRVCGAVFMTKPKNEVQQAMFGITAALILAGAMASTLLLIPAYIASLKFSKPLRTMTDIASKMAAGDFSARAEETRTNEIGQLGMALNYLSKELDANIQEIISTRNRLHLILESLGEGIISMDRNMNPTYSNPSARALLGCDIKETGDLPATLIDTARRVLSGGAADTCHLHAGEAEILITVSPTQENETSQTSVVALMQDVTEQERLEQTRRDYVANVSHELRTPIASIRSLAEALNDGLIHKDEDKSRYYGYILRESMRLTRLINDLLELSRLQSGSIALEKAAFAVGDVLKDIAERMTPAASDSGISLNLELDESLPQAYSNRDRIEQIVISLVDNAIKYAEDDGRVLLSAKPMDTQNDHTARSILISVRNTGHIDPKDLPHLFDRFYKADASHSEGGTGLGLAIAQELMNRLNERIWAENDGSDVVFHITVCAAS